MQENNEKKKKIKKFGRKPYLWFKVFFSSSFANLTFSLRLWLTEEN